MYIRLLTTLRGRAKLPFVSSLLVVSDTGVRIPLLKPGLGGLTTSTSSR